jgi:metal-dependent amidase/aminoacylase/carboxypeptidase family protein
MVPVLLLSLMLIHVSSMAISFHGKTSHAAEPENGVSPSLPVAWVLVGLDRLANRDVDDPKFRGITPVFINVGERGANGVTPGDENACFSFDW